MDYYNFFKDRHERELERRNDFWPKYAVLISYLVILFSGILAIIPKVYAVQYKVVFLIFFGLAAIFAVVSVVLIIHSFKYNTLINFSYAKEWLDWYKNLDSTYSENSAKRDEDFKSGVIEAFSRHATENKKLNDKRGYQLKNTLYAVGFSTLAIIVSYFITLLR